MANAKMCDRCGTFYVRDRNYILNEKSAKGFPVCGIRHEGYINTYDLCPECYDELIKFMRIDTKGEQNYG